MQLTIQAGGKLQGKITVPGDKSISHRSVMLAAIAQGTSEIEGILKGDDVLCTIAAMKAIGVQIEETADRLIVHGQQTFNDPEQAIYLGNSGTSIRLLSGLFCGLNINTTFTGDKSLNQRPMQRIITPLSQMGCSIQATENGTPPLQIQANPNIKAINYTLPIPSAQVKSSILLAGLFAEGTTKVIEPAVSRNHTELMLQSFGVELDVQGNTVTLRGKQTLKAQNLKVPSDISSAAFFLIGASICPDSHLILENIGINPTRNAVIQILQQMGANIKLHNQRLSGSEPIADIEVQYAPLKGIDFDQALIPIAIDEFPALFVAAATAQGKSTLRNASELRHKESDRIGTMVNALKQLGVNITEYPDGVDIIGGDLNPPAQPINSHHDHRIAMALTLAGMKLNHGELTLTGCETIQSSFPNYPQLMQQAGMRIKGTSIYSGAD